MSKYIIEWFVTCIIVNMWENSDKVLDRFFKNKIKG